MRNRKDILLLLIALVVLGVVNYLMPREDSLSSAGKHGLVEAAAESRALTVIRPSASFALRREDVGWRIIEPFSARADEQKVMKLLDAIATTAVGDRLSEAELLKLDRTRADFGLENPEIVLRFDLSADGTVELAFGAVTPDGEGTYVARTGSPLVFVVPKALRDAVDVSAEIFRSRAVLARGGELVEAFDVRQGPGSVLKFQRQDGVWQVGGQRARGEKVVRFLADLAVAEAVDFVWPIGASNETDHASAALLASYGLDPDTAVTVTLKGQDGVGRQVAFGCEAGEGLVYALVQNGGAIVTVKSALREAVMQGEGLFADARVFAIDNRAVRFVSLMDGNVLYSLARGEDGHWTFESPISAPADSAAVEAVLSRLLTLTSSDVVGKDGLTVSVATNLPSAMVSARSVFGDGSVEDLRTREMIRIDATLVKRIVRTAGQTSVAVVYDRERSAWSVEAETGSEGVANADGIARVTAALNPLTAMRVVRVRVQASDLDDYGLDQPAFTIAVDQSAADSVRKNILIGAAVPGGRYATIGSSDAVFVISTETVENLTAPVSSSVP